VTGLSQRDRRSSPLSVGILVAGSAALTSAMAGLLLSSVLSGLVAALIAAGAVGIVAGFSTSGSV
jgi:hypothetical protein